MGCTDVLVIGAGPSGAIASKLLIQKGFSVTVVERETFPRFSIGESLLPHAMSFLEEAGMADTVKKQGFQYKDGASFLYQGKNTVFDFHQKYSDGPATTFQVQRGIFDKLLADNAAAAGVDIHYGETLVKAELEGQHPVLMTKDKQGNHHRYQGRFVLDASGFGRVLPRMLNMETPSGFPVRQSLFTHVQDNIDLKSYDRNKISIVVHPRNARIWYWLIPFADGRSSLGVVAEESVLNHYSGSHEDTLRRLVSETPDIAQLLANAIFDTPVNCIAGYSANVSQLYGPHFLLLGNAGEFLDPVFSSGVTIAMKSASLAADVVGRYLAGENIDWNQAYAVPLQKGIDTFRTYVQAWYDGDFQKIIFYPRPENDIKSMICSILAGYAWDETNPFVAHSERRMKALAEICSQ